MGNLDSWTAFYPDAARDFDEVNIELTHLAEVTEVAADQYGVRPAVSTQLPTGACTTLNFKEVHRLSSNFAIYLREVAGVRSGDVVAVMLPNCIDFPIAVFGILKAGCICTNINPLYTAREMENQLKDSGAKALVIIDLFGEKADAITDNNLVQQVIKVSLLDYFPPLKKIVMGFVLRRVKKLVPEMRTAHVTMATALKQGAEKQRTGGIEVSTYRSGQNINDTALYQYTGGTTGRSKGAELTHRNTLVNAALATSMYTNEIPLAKDDCALVVLPLYHVTAFVLNMLQGFLNGMHSVMIPNPRPITNLKQAFENHAITHLVGINTLFSALLEQPWCTRNLFKHLRFCGSGGAAQQVTVAERWEAQTGVPIHQGYGLTECAGVLIMNPASGNRLGSAGIPLPGTTVKIVDSQGNELPRGKVGELIAKGPVIMKGYLNRPDETGATIQDGYLHTGDVGIMDEDGYVQIVERKKDMILVSGFNVYPNEIEDVITELDGVLEVAVIGVPDEKTGESVKAYVVSSDPGMTADQILVHCKASLTNYKRPKCVEFIAELPKTPVGKVLRRSLRDTNHT